MANATSGDTGCQYPITGTSPVPEPRDAPPVPMAWTARRMGRLRLARRLISWAPGRASPSAGWSCDPVANLRHDERTAPWVPPLAARIRIGQAALFVSQFEFDPSEVLRCVELRGEIEPETFALSP